MADTRPHPLLSLFVWLLPASSLKNRLLKALGNTIGPGVRVSPTLVAGCGPFTIGENTRFSAFNVFRGLRRVDVGRDAWIGTLNWFSAEPAYQEHHPEAGLLRMGDLCIITNRHHFDCSGRIILEPRGAIGGIKSIFQSHEIDLVADRTTVGTIRLGQNAMTGTACLVLKGAYLPDRSILAAGSLLAKANPDTPPESGLYVGRPARKVRELDYCAWWDRTSPFTPVTPFTEI